MMMMMSAPLESTGQLNCDSSFGADDDRCQCSYEFKTQSSDVRICLEKKMLLHHA